MNYSAENFTRESLKIDSLPEDLKESANFLLDATSNFQDKTVLADKSINEFSNVFFDTLNMYVKKNEQKAVPQATPKAEPTEKKRSAKPVKVVPKPVPSVPKAAKTATKTTKTPAARKAKPAANDRPKRLKRAEYLEEADKIIGKDIDPKKVISAIKVINTARKINVLRGFYAEILDNPVVHKKRLAPTVENLNIWAKNPGRYDMIGVDAPGSIGDVTIRKKEQSIVDALKQEVALAYDYVEQLEKTVSELGMTMQKIERPAKKIRTKKAKK